MKSTRTIAPIAFLAFAVLFSDARLQAQDKPTEAWAGKPTLKWEYKADEAIESSPAIGTVAVFVADAMGKVYAVDRQTGKELWRRDFDTGFLVSPAIAPKDSAGESSEASDKIFIGDYEGNFYAIDGGSGETIWEYETDGEISGTAAFHDQNVLVTSQDGSLYCFAIKDGELKWRYQTQDQVQCSPAIAGGRSFLGGCDGKLHMVDLNTGEAVGEPLELGGPTGSTPAVFADRVYVPIMDGVVYAFNWKEASQTWVHEDPERAQEYRSSPAADGKRVIVSSARKQIDALSALTGERLWRHSLLRRADATPVIFSGFVWIAATDGRLIRLSVEDGESSWEYEVRGSFLSGPVFDQQFMWIADDKGVLRCFEAKAGQSRAVKE